MCLLSAFLGHDSLRTEEEEDPTTLFLSSSGKEETARLRRSGP